MIDLLARHNCVDDLRRIADVGDSSVAERLVDLLVRNGRIEDAIAFLDRRMTRGDSHARSG